MSTAPAQNLVNAPSFVRVALADEIPPGWVLRVQLASRALAIANSEGTLYAFDHACSHAGGPLGDNRLREGCFVECPWHNAIFDVRTGEVCRGPARTAQRTYEVRVDNGTVFVAVD